MAINQEKKQEIKNSLELKLKEKSRQLKCPICENSSFILADGFTQDSLQEGLTGIVLGGRSIPVIIVICDHCGYVLRFSLGVLGLLPKSEAEKGLSDGNK